MEDFVFNSKTKELKTSDKDLKPCAPGGVGKIIFAKMYQHANDGLIAQIEAETGFKDSFQNFLLRCKKLGIYLKEIGIQSGDIILTCSPNTKENSVPLFSSFFIGAICTYIDPTASLECATYLLKLTEPKLLIVDKEYLGFMEKVKLHANINCELITLQHDSNYENLPSIMKRYPDDSNIVQNFEPIFIEDLNTTACILFSSGSTGMPKGACLSHNYIITYVFTKADDEILKLYDKQAIAWGFTSLYWLSGIHCILLACFYGVISLTSRSFSKQTVWEIVEKFKVNMLVMSYYYCTEALETIRKPQLSINILSIVGGQISAKDEDFYALMFPNGKIINSYGMTEIGTVTQSNDYKNRSAGKPKRKELTFKIVDQETGQPLDLNQIGEIRIRGKHQMNGYYKQDSTDCWDNHGFFKTGDVGYLTNDYHLFIVDRIKEMFKYSHWQVIPSKIERHILKHPQVQHCVVIGVPVPKDDHHAMAIVVLKENDNNSDSRDISDELLKFANDEMDEIYQLRAGVKIVSKSVVPFTVNGKINRKLLRDQILGFKTV